MRIRLNQSWGETHFPIWAQPVHRTIITDEDKWDDEEIVWLIVMDMATRGDCPSWAYANRGVPCYFESLGILLSVQPGIVDLDGAVPILPPTDTSTS